jgi:hypothetical protein
MLGLLIDDGHVRDAAGQAAKQRIQEQYLWPKIAKEIEQIYLEMVGWANEKTASPGPTGGVPSFSSTTRERVA